MNCTGISFLHGQAPENLILTSRTILVKMGHDLMSPFSHVHSGRIDRYLFCCDRLSAKMQSSVLLKSFFAPFRAKEKFNNRNLIQALVFTFKKF